MIAIIGGKGMLGSEIVAKCRVRGIEAREYDLPEFDITKEAAIEEVAGASDIIINCAAYTDVEKAESQEALAYAVNAEAVGKLGRAAGKHGAWVLHFGTDFVFDGMLDRPYREDDATNPLSVYGKSKLEGEKNLIASNCRHCIIRIEWTYGTHGNNFVRKVIEACTTRKELKIVDDQIGAPTATSEIASMVCGLIAAKPTGIYHFAAAGYASRFEMAEFIVRQKGLAVNVMPCKTSDYKTAAARPLNSRFDCAKIRNLTGAEIEGWQEPLKRFLETL